MLSILGFLIMLAPLVIVHELGHFLFAKLFNVKAEAFSIGFGPRVWRRQIGETEWRLSLIPLGGYVKLLGEDPEAPLSAEDKPRALQYQARWKRFFIFFGGPLFNFLWAILVYMTILAVGEPQMASYVGRVVPSTQAEKAGFLSGDFIQSVNGEPVRKFEEVNAAVDKNPEKEMTFVVNRKDLRSGAVKTVDVKVTPHKADGFSVYGEQTHVGEIDGFIPTARAGTVGISNLDSLAGKSGLRTGDLITQFADVPVKSWEEIEAVYTAIPVGTSFSIGAKAKTKTDGPLTTTWTKPAKSVSLGEDFGAWSSEVFIEKAVEKSPAKEAGIRTGDRIMTIDGSNITHFFALKEAVQKGGEKNGKIKVAWEREGKRIEETISPTATVSRDALLNKVTQYTIGVIPSIVWAEPVTIVERILNPFTLIYRGTERMIIFSYRNFVSIKKMFTGDVSVATLGGPILIGQIAGDSLSRGLVAFLSTMAILSIGLGVLNILPVPVLDGGHILLLLIEAVRGKPLSMKQMEAVQMFGLSMIGILMLVVLKNDLTRLPFFN
ncbi:MAG: RIP metalloprotease RseP [Cryobacterium sp.]|nr:RIP metalloprotease RseP [Oligoflexia bacterium]